PSPCAVHPRHRHAALRRRSPGARRLLLSCTHGFLPPPPRLGGVGDARILLRARVRDQRPCRNLDFSTDHLQQCVVLLLVLLIALGHSGPPHPWSRQSRVGGSLAVIR